MRVDNGTEEISYHHIITSLKDVRKLKKRLPKRWPYFLIFKAV